MAAPIRTRSNIRSAPLRVALRVAGGSSANQQGPADRSARAGGGGGGATRCCSPRQAVGDSVSPVASPTRQASRRSAAASAPRDLQRAETFSCAVCWRSGSRTPATPGRAALSRACPRPAATGPAERRTSCARPLPSPLPRVSATCPSPIRGDRHPLPGGTVRLTPLRLTARPRAQRQATASDQGRGGSGKARPWFRLAERQGPD